MKKVLEIIFNIIMYIIMLFAIIIVVISLNTHGLATEVGGIYLFSIQTGSMEPTIKSGDLILTNKVNTGELKENDIISFLAMENDTQIIKTHRIIEIKDDGGIISYITKGDNNSIEDASLVAPGDIISAYSGTRIPYLGKIIDVLKSKIGFFFCIIIPLFIFFIYQIIKFIFLIKEYKNYKLKHSKR